MRKIYKSCTVLFALFFLTGWDLHSIITERFPALGRDTGTPAAAQFGHTPDMLYGMPAGMFETIFSSTADFIKPAQVIPTAPVQARAPVDDVLLVPARVQAARPSDAITIVAPDIDQITVERGDTVFAISRRTNVPVRDLITINNLSAPYALRVGQTLRIPSVRMHTVRAGETLYSISRAHSVDPYSLARANNLPAPFGLSIGQQLQLPATIARPSVPETPIVVAAAPTPPVVTTPAAAVPAAPTPVAPVITEQRTISSAPTGRLPPTPPRSGTHFAWPVQGRIVSSFGATGDGLHNDGINIAARAGTPVRAAEAGVVAYAGNELRGMGNLIIIQHSGGFMTVYAHMDTMTVRRGARVAMGEQIGTVGQTGRVTEPQLHFGIRQGTRALNPTAHLRR